MSIESDKPLPTLKAEEITSLYIGHLPVTITEEDLRKDFEKYGNLARSVAISFVSCCDSADLGLSPVFVSIRTEAMRSLITAMPMPVSAYPCMPCLPCNQPV